MDRIVVCFRWRGARPEAVAAGVGQTFSQSAAELLRRRSVLGGRLVAWHARAFAFDFPAGAVEAAIELLVGTGFDVGAGLEAFGVGIAQGEVAVLETRGDWTLGSGTTLERAAALANIADPGDVLLDPLLDVVQAGQLLTRGAVMGASGGQRIRGQRLDRRYPWRRPVTVRLASCPLVGLGPTELLRRRGELAFLIAQRGCGGTRFLEEVAREVGATHLVVTPWRVGEPLGGLRDAFERAAPGGNELDPTHASSLEALLAGEGLDVETAGALIAAWVGPGGAVLCDDAAELDRDTVEAMACACRDHGVPLVARVLDLAHLPAPLADLPRGGTTMLAPLDPDEAESIVRTTIGQTMDAATVARWARRGGGRPLAILEAMRYGLETAELVTDRESVIPRNRVGGRGGAQPARHWLMGRLRFLEDDARAALDALLVLGGRATPEVLRRFFELVAVDASVEVLRDELSRAGWIDVDATGHLVLTSATLRDVLHELLLVERRAQWHIAAAQLASEDPAPLAAGRAAVHAFLGGEAELCAAQARLAAGAARAAGLESTAEAFAALSADGDLSLVMARGLLGGVSPRRPSRPSVIPRDRLASALQVVGADDGLSGKARAALRRGDLESVTALAQKLREDDENAALAERLEAMASLRRGDTAEALRLLRAAKLRAQPLDAVERCRAALAYGVALSAAGRMPEALLEGLEALARAREVGDAQGERATARFIAQLTDQAGHHEFARAWRALAE